VRDSRLHRPSGRVVKNGGCCRRGRNQWCGDGLLVGQALSGDDVHVGRALSGGDVHVGRALSGGDVHVGHALSGGDVHVGRALSGDGRVHGVGFAPNAYRRSG
jgi:hypothetical protein